MNSQELFARAQDLIPGGVNSPVRACKSVNTQPLFINHARQGRITTVDGQEMVDFLMSWGPLLLGHAHEEVNSAARKAASKGTSFGAPCAVEVDMAQAITDAVPGMDMVRMVTSGTEATMSALRLARGYTGKNKVIKFHGCYHGHADSFLASAGSGVATLSIPGTPGVPPETVTHTLLAHYNDLEGVRALFAEHGKDIAALIVEPVAGNMGLVLPEEGFLEGLRTLCNDYAAVLIFDEVITGFRVDFGGAVKRFGIEPDLITLGKIIGGGYPTGAYGGKRAIMQHAAPVGEVYQAGTLAGNPVAMAAGLKTLHILKTANYAALEERTAILTRELSALFEEKGIPVTINTIASLFTVFFTDSPVRNFEEAKKADQQRYASFYTQMRQQNINLAPSAFECAFTSFAHSQIDYDMFLSAVRAVNI